MSDVIKRKIKQPCGERLELSLGDLFIIDDGNSVLHKERLIGNYRKVMHKWQAREIYKFLHENRELLLKE